MPSHFLIGQLLPYQIRKALTIPKRFQIFLNINCPSLLPSPLPPTTPKKSQKASNSKTPAEAMTLLNSTQILLFAYKEDVPSTSK